MWNIVSHNAMRSLWPSVSNVTNELEVKTSMIFNIDYIQRFEVGKIFDIFSK